MEGHRQRQKIHRRDSRAPRRSTTRSPAPLSAYALRSLQELADPTHILWGSDLPFVYGERLQEEVDHWEAYDGFDAAARLAWNNKMRCGFFRDSLALVKFATKS